MSVAFFWLSATRSAGFMSQIRLLVSDTVDITMEYGITTVVVDRFTASRAEKVTHATWVSFLEMRPAGARSVTFITGGVSYGDCACAPGTRGNASTTTASQIPTLTGHAGRQLHLVFAAAVMTGVPSGRGS